MEEINYLLIIISAFFVFSSPGPATLSIAATSMNQGRLAGSILAFGMLFGSVFWSTLAAFGFSNIMYLHSWFFESVKYIGALYLLYLAYKSAKSSFKDKSVVSTNTLKLSLVNIFFKGLFIHITNPKAILFFASLYAVGIPVNSSKEDLLNVILILAIESFIVFQTYAYIFSIKKIRDIYIKLEKWFERFFALFFAFASFKIITSRI